MIGAFGATPVAASTGMVDVTVGPAAAVSPSVTKDQVTMEGSGMPSRSLIQVVRTTSYFWPFPNGAACVRVAGWSSYLMDPGTPIIKKVSWLTVTGSTWPEKVA